MSYRSSEVLMGWLAGPSEPLSMRRPAVGSRENRTSRSVQASLAEDGSCKQAVPNAMSPSRLLGAARRRPLLYHWNPIHLIYGGTYRYVQVCTALYRLVLLWRTYWYVLLVNFRMVVHTGTCTYWYRQMTKSVY